MTRYIKVRNLEDYIAVHMNYRKAEEELYKPDIYKGIRIAYGDVFKAIESTPTADVVEVVQTLWKKTAKEKPNSTRHLIVANGSLISHYGYYLKPKDKWYKTYECEEEIEVPTYWMDMPTPPKESIYGECAVMDGKKVE